ncbi:MAG: hypothetical protein E7488_04495 [Ruminococcaceae bacterium]|nr:hypothetical protein [Oscillospiraceae bacterium]
MKKSRLVAIILLLLWFIFRAEKIKTALGIIALFFTINSIAMLYFLLDIVVVFILLKIIFHKSKKKPTPQTTEPTPKQQARAIKKEMMDELKVIAHKQ